MIQQNKKVLGIIFANMHDTLISDLTKDRTMGSIPFGGRYRLIDFPLSSMVHSGINNIGLVTKSNYQSLMNHLGSGSEWDLARKKDGLYILPPFGHANHGLYRGKFEALGGAWRFIAASKAKYVVFSDCNIISNIDYKPFIEAHIASGADATVMYARRKVDENEKGKCTVIETDNDGKVIDVMCEARLNGEFNVCVDTVIMESEFLIKKIHEFHSKGLYSFDRDFLQKGHKDYNIQSYCYEGLMMHINSIQQYYEANMSLLDTNIRKQLFIPNKAIYTKVRDEAPTRYGFSASVKNSLINDGCIIEGTVENSVLFRGVRVEKGAVVRNSILMQETVVEDSRLEYVVADKHVTITANHPMLGSKNHPIFISKSKVI